MDNSSFRSNISAKSKERRAFFKRKASKVSFSVEIASEAPNSADFVVND